MRAKNNQEAISAINELCCLTLAGMSETVNCQNVFGCDNCAWGLAKKALKQVIEIEEVVRGNENVQI